MSPELDKVSLHHQSTVPRPTANSSLKTRVSKVATLSLRYPHRQQVYSQFLVNQVPAEWRRRGFASLKPLGSWMKDLRWRVRFFELWLERGNPYAFSLPAFFFPQV